MQILRYFCLSLFESQQKSMRKILLDCYNTQQFEQP